MLLCFHYFFYIIYNATLSSSSLMQYAYGINVRFETRRRYYVCIELFLTKAFHGTQHFNLVVELHQEKRTISATALLSLSILTSPGKMNRREKN